MTWYELLLTFLGWELLKKFLKDNMPNLHIKNILKVSINFFKKTKQLWNIVLIAIVFRLYQAGHFKSDPILQKKLTILLLLVLIIGLAQQYTIKRNKKLDERVSI